MRDLDLYSALRALADFALATRDQRAGTAAVNPGIPKACLRLNLVERQGAIGVEAPRVAVPFSRLVIGDNQGGRPWHR